LNCDFNTLKTDSGAVTREAGGRTVPSALRLALPPGGIGRRDFEGTGFSIRGRRLKAEPVSNNLEGQTNKPLILPACD
jgi:hypothetical protein